MRMVTRIDVELDQLAEELERLNKETADLTRNFSIDQVSAMRSGVWRHDIRADGNEAIAREKFARIREIEAILNTHHGN